MSRLVYKSIFPFRTRCGSSLHLQTPQSLPWVLNGLLPCSVCVLPKEPDDVTSPCLERYATQHERTAPWSETFSLEITDSGVDGVVSGSATVLRWQSPPLSAGWPDLCYHHALPTTNETNCEYYHGMAVSSGFVWNTRTPNSDGAPAFGDHRWINWKFPNVEDCRQNVAYSGPIGLGIGAFLQCSILETEPDSNEYESRLYLMMVFSHAKPNWEAATSYWKFDVSGATFPGLGVWGGTRQLIPPSADPVDFTFSGDLLCEYPGANSNYGSLTFRLREIVP